jgi:hypothetical protein
MAPRSGQLHGPVIVAVITMRMMQPSAHEIIDVVTMRNGFMPTGRAVLVCAAGLRRAMDGIGSVDRDDMFVDVVLMHMVEVAIMQIVDVTFMADAGMSTVCAMLMSMVGMVRLGATGHGLFSFWSAVRRGSAIIAFRQRAPWHFRPNSGRDCRKANSRYALPFGAA